MIERSGFVTRTVCGMLNKLAGEANAAYLIGTKLGDGATNIFPGLVGKTFEITDTGGSTTTKQSILFRAADFLDTERPTINEVVTRINAVTEETHASSVAITSESRNYLKITSQTNALVLTVGGTAAPLLGFSTEVQGREATVPDIICSAVTGAGITISFADLDDHEIGFGHAIAPLINVGIVADGAVMDVVPKVYGTDYTAAWDMSAKTVTIIDALDSADWTALIHVTLTFPSALQ